jgi:hypothetical protein
MVLRATAAAALIGLCAAAGPARSATIHIYSYDPADAETAKAAGPLTFTIRKGLLRTWVLNLRSTTAQATAYLALADERELGGGGPAGPKGRDPMARTLYRIEPQADGPALVSAFCPGATRGWLAFGPIRFDQPLSVLALGAPAVGPAKLCRSLNFSFRGEWRLPPGGSIDPRELERGRYPGA